MKLNPSNTSIVKRLLSSRNSRPLVSILNKIEPADIASLFTQFNAREKHLLLEVLMHMEKASSALMEVPDSHLWPIFKDFDSKKITKLILSSPSESAAHFLSEFPEDEREKVLLELDEGTRLKINQLLSYPEDSAGRIMQNQPFCIPSHFTAGEGLETLREKAQEQSIYYIYCVDKENRLEGVVSLRALATAQPDLPLEKLIKKEVVTVSPLNTSEEVAKIVAHYDFIAIPVCDEDRKMMGIITIDDVVEIIQEQATANIYAQAGLQEDDRVYSDIPFKIKTRLPWMCLNLFLAAMASSVVSLFEETMNELILVAVLKNIVAGMGGNTAIQTLTVVTRGIAVGDFNFISQSKSILKETVVGLTMGLMMGLFASLLVYFWKGDQLVAGVIFVSMILNSLVASSFGALVPIALNRFNLDPATGSGVIVTMVTDMFGFFSFLGIATLCLKYMGA